MLMAVKDSYLLLVQPDDVMISPREVDETLGTIVCFHPRYALGDHHNYIDHDDFLREMYLNTVGHDEKGMKRYEWMVNAIWSRKMTGPNRNEQAVAETMLNVIAKKYIMLPLYLLDHSGLAMKTVSFHDPWDSAQVGWIYVSKEDALKAFDRTEMTPKIREMTKKALRDEVEIYDAYLRGECYGYELYEKGELKESCWGFIGDMDEVRKGIAERLPDDCKDMVDHLEERSQPRSIIQTLLQHAKIQIDQASKNMEHKPRQQTLGDAR